MRKLTLTVMAGSALALAACGGNKAANNTAAMNSANTMSANSAAPMTPAANASTNAGATAAAGAWPADSRIVEEGGVTYRVDANGTRTRLTASDSRIVTERGVRYRVDPDGSRVRISPEGVRIGDSVIRGNAPNGRSDVETPGETLTDAGEDAVEAIGDIDGK